MILLSCRRRSDKAGFTLVEALVATLLMGMILAALATVTAQWLPNWNRGFARVQQAELLAIAVERLAADLEAAEFVSPNRKTDHPLFEGTELSATFVRSAIGPNARSGLDIVRISETAGRQGPVLVRARAAFVPNSGSIDQLFFRDPVVLLRPPYRLSFAYAGKDGAWKSGWHDSATLPSAVRLSVRDAATDRVLPVSTIALVHADLPAACVGGAGDCDEADQKKNKDAQAKSTDSDRSALRSE
ncbi:MAG TPA: type II secretion system protein [Pseudolabrys sp.]